jgi:hypothetical protein
VLLLWRADPACLVARLPPGAQPLAQRGSGWVAISVGRSEPLRGRFLPRAFPGSADHLALRIAATFDELGESVPGWWTVRHDTSSWIEARLGGTARLAAWRRAAFKLTEDAWQLEASVCSGTSEALYLRARTSPVLRGSAFPSAREAQEFLTSTRCVRPHPVFDSDTGAEDLLRGACAPEPLAVFELRCALVDDGSLFPRGALQADSAFRLVERRAAGLGERARLGLYDSPPSPALPAL